MPLKSRRTKPDGLECGTGPLPLSWFSQGFPPAFVVDPLLQPSDRSRHFEELLRHEVTIDAASIDRVRQASERGSPPTGTKAHLCRFNFDLSLSPAKVPRLTYARASKGQQRSYRSLQRRNPTGWPVRSLYMAMRSLFSSKRKSPSGRGRCLCHPRRCLPCLM